MANPQTENGFTKIANELLEEIIKTKMSDYEHRIFWFIVRKTYGYNKKSDWITQTQIVKGTNILKQHVSRTIKKLKGRNMIEEDRKKLSVQKDYDEWKLPKQVTNKVTQRGYSSNPDRLPKVTHTGVKSNLKELPQKKKERKLLKKEGLTLEEKRNYAQGMSKERSWKSKKEKPGIIKKEFDYSDKTLNKEAKICHKEFGSSCSVRKEKGINNKCIVCLINRRKWKS